MKNKKETRAVRRTHRTRGARVYSSAIRAAVQNKNSLKSRIKAIVFDFDGVVIDTLPRALEVWGHAFKEFKITHVTLNKDFFESDYRAMAQGLNISKHNLGKLDRLANRIVVDLHPTAAIRHKVFPSDAS